MRYRVSLTRHYHEEDHDDGMTCDDTVVQLVIFYKLNTRSRKLKPDKDGVGCTD